MSYKDPRSANDGAAIEVSVMGRNSGEVILTLGTMREYGSISPDAWAALTQKEAREVADDLYAASRRAEGDRK